MKLNLLERVMLISILPQEANFVDLKIVNDLRMAASFTEKEVKEYGITTDEDRVNWLPEAAEKQKDIDVGARGIEIITKALTKLNDEEKLSAQTYTL